MKLNLLLATFISATFLNAADTDKKEDLINKLLPKNSSVRLIHNKEPRRTGLFGYDSTTRSSCDRVESTLQQLFEDLDASEKAGSLKRYYAKAIFLPQIIYDFKPYFTQKIEQEVQILMDDNYALYKEEMTVIDTALTPAWDRAQAIQKAEQAKSAAAARVAIEARYK